MEIIKSVGNIAYGVGTIIKKGFIYLVIGSLTGAVLFTILIAMILYTM